MTLDYVSGLVLILSGLDKVDLGMNFPPTARDEGDGRQSVIRAFTQELYRCME